MTTRTKNLLKKLKEAAQSAGESIFNRTKIAAEILTDQAWVTDQGNRKRAVKHLQEEYFPELSRAISLNHLLTLFEAYPAIEEWEDYNFNLGRLWARYEEERAATSPRGERQTATLKDLKEKDDQLEELGYHLRKSKEDTESLKTENDALRLRNRELEGEVARLEGRIAELERLVERYENKLQPV